VFDRVLGIPAHALYIHAAVVLVPILALLAVLYAVWPASRRHIRWTLVAFAVATPGAVYFAKESGEQLAARLFPAPLSGPVAEHADLAGMLFWLTLGLTAVALVMAFMVPVTAGAPTKINAPVAAHWVVAGLAVVLSAVAMYYVFQTGDTGAHMVWS
jgi:hypothetical protein